MDYKLKAISKNLDNDQIDLLVLKKTHKNSNELLISTNHVCRKNIPVIFSTQHGIHLRTHSTNFTNNNYSVTFCDLKRWVRFKS